MRACSKLLLSACLLGFGAAPCGVAVAQGGLQPAGRIVVYEGMCEPSAAVAVTSATGQRLVVVANDGDNVLRAYDAGRGGPPVSVVDLNGFLRIKGRADMEGAARLGDRIFWIASHSRENDHGELRPSRHRFFATGTEPAPRTDGTGAALRPIGSPRSLMGALTEERLGLRAAIGTDKRGKPRERDANNKAETNGLNIEGLARGRQEGTLLIGLRNPLGADGKAILLPFVNPREVVDRNGARPVLGTPIALDLRGRGVRSIEYAERAPPARRYLIVAGPPSGGDDFTLYGWSGKPGDRPTEMAGAAEMLRGLAAGPDPRGEVFRFGPEALVVDPEGRTIHLLSDDGDRRIGGPNGPKCQADGNPVERRSFRGVVLRLD